MRTTMTALLCSFAATACVAPIGERDHSLHGPDAGVDGATATGACDDLEQRIGDLTISGTSAFSGLPTTCWKLTGKLTLTGPAVASVAKLGDLRSVSDLEINDTDLTKLDARGPIEVTGDIYIHHNDLLTDVANVAPRSSVRSIRVESNPALTGLGGLGKATIVTGETRITNNVKLAAADLASAQRLEGGVVIQDNAALAAITLSSLQSVGNVTIARNAALTSIGTSAALSNVHGTVTIDDNDNLRSLGSFGSSLIVDVGVIVSNNAKLADVGQLAHASQIFGVVQINNNLQLDPTRAHDVGCCVLTGGFASSNNQNVQCSGNHWCLNTQNCYR